MVLIGALMVLAAFAAAYWGFKNGFRSPGKAMVALMVAVALLGGALGLLNYIGR